MGCRLLLSASYMVAHIVALAYPEDYLRKNIVSIKDANLRHNIEAMWNFIWITSKWI